MLERTPHPSPTCWLSSWVTPKGPTLSPLSPDEAPLQGSAIGSSLPEFGGARSFIINYWVSTRLDVEATKSNKKESLTADRLESRGKQRDRQGDQWLQFWGGQCYDVGLQNVAETDKHLSDWGDQRIAQQQCCLEARENTVEHSLFSCIFGRFQNKVLSYLWDFISEQTPHQHSKP